MVQYRDNPNTIRGSITREEHHNNASANRDSNGFVLNAYGFDLALTR
jgi:hypothetical protein